MSAPMTLRFRDTRGDQQYQLEAELLIIGRTEDCDIQISDDTISRNHARIVKQGDSFVLEDLKSRNGVFANNRPIESISLRDGMVLRLGNVSILVESKNSSSLAVRLTDDRPEQGVMDSLMIDDFRFRYGKQ